MAINIKAKKPKYYLNPRGEFVIENYNFSKPFANFFPGIAGKYGIPMWTFYVNRCQAIASFGTKDKDRAILEFFPANKSWQFVSTNGFRTFMKIGLGKKTVFYEPFHNGFANLGLDLTNRMLISPSGLRLEEENLTLGINISVDYFNIPNDSYAGLARIVTLRNLRSSTLDIQLLDGLPQIVPFGTTNSFLKMLSRTIEAWIEVKNLEKGVPLYKLDTDPTDRPEVVHIKEGNFYLGFSEGKNSAKIIKPIIDPEHIFGQATDFSCPHKFLEAAEYKAPKNESIKSKTPCAFLPVNFALKKGEEKTFSIVSGYVRSIETLNTLVPRVTSPGYLDKKKQENKNLINDLQDDIDTKSSSAEFNLYSKQTYLDNIMRGGYPIVLGQSREANAKQQVFYLYSRKHGDLERDYNNFLIQPTYFSQGNANYRDINQNRRCDNWFYPEISDENIIFFLSLIQTDGFNPLVVKGITFTLEDTEAFKILAKDLVGEKNISELLNFLKKPFTPGDVILYLEDNDIKVRTSYDDFLNILLSSSVKHREAEHGEGFWTDHWAYNLDLLENYLGVYPEKLKEIIFEKKSFTYFDNTEVVRPRAEKYVLYNNRPRQLYSVTLDNAKREMIRKRTAQPHLVRADYGNGDIYKTSLINKLLSILANKISSLDPSGVGIEMEANKPNWYDALNGLPALFGSSLCETLELKRLVIFIKDSLEKTGVQKLFLTEEVHHFLAGINNLLEEYLNNPSDNKNFEYWDKSSTLKEDYRHKTHLGLSGKELELTTPSLTQFCNRALIKLDEAIRKAQDKKTGVYFAYFIHEVKEFQTLKEHFIKPKQFKRICLPFFLESQMHALRLAKDQKEAKNIFDATKKSHLYDKKLKMYKITCPLKSMPEEIGRCRAFTPGWLENESIWLHMEYKYILEVLKKGLFEEFYRDFKSVMIPFQNPERYGRNILENSSFLVSSAFGDSRLHGNGFVARLSGSTAEFLQIWLVMNTGKNPFFLDKENKLNLRLHPALAGWLFDKKGLYSFNFLSKVRINYHNPKRKNTFGRNPAKTKRIVLRNKDGESVEIPSDIIPSPYAEQIRSRQIKQIDIYLET